MRDLIRATLFIFAHTGLFLTVLAWIVGQWTSMSVLLPLPTGTAGAQLTAESWEYRQISARFHIAVTDVVSTQHSSIHTRTTHEAFMLMSVISHVSAEPIVRDTDGSGINYSHIYIPIEDHIEIYHWLIIAIFVAFNIFLHFIYRKRPEVQPCEN